MSKKDSKKGGGKAQGAEAHIWDAPAINWGEIVGWEVPIIDWGELPSWELPLWEETKNKII